MDLDTQPMPTGHTLTGFLFLPGKLLSQSEPRISINPNLIETSVIALKSLRETLPQDSVTCKRTKRAGISIKSKSGKATRGDASHVVFCREWVLLGLNPSFHCSPQGLGQLARVQLST